METDMYFTAAEKPIIVLTALLAILDVSLLLVKNIGIDVLGYLGPVLIGVFVVAAGQFYRVVRPDVRISSALTAAGLFILFTLVGSVFNYLLLPVHFPIVDGYLVQLDATMGYHWPTMVERVSKFPWVGGLLGIVYFTSMPQLILALLCLGFWGTSRELNHMLLTGVIGALFCMLSWWFFPSFGASSVHTLAPEILEIVPVAVNPEYGAEILRLGREGVTFISPLNVLGLIGFPSFHTVMSCMSVVFMKRYRWAFVPILLLNFVMVPAILVHGGHHLSDMIGGVLVFVFAYVSAGAIIRRRLETHADISVENGA